MSEALTQLNQSALAPVRVPPKNPQELTRHFLHLQLAILTHLNPSVQDPTAPRAQSPPLCSNLAYP